MTTLIIDGNNLVQRAAWAIYRGDFAQADGERIAESVILTIRRHQRMFSRGDLVPVIACFDGKGATERKRLIYDGYKSGRPEKVPAIEDAIAYLRDQRHLMGSLRYDGVEADDLIATAARILSDEEGRQVVVLTSDRDLFQIIGPNRTVRMVRQKATEYDDFDEVQWEKTKPYAPALIADYKALAGDTSDSIPGVTGIGPTYAHELVRDIGGIDRIYGNIWMVKRSNVKKYLTDGRDDAYRFLSLTKLDDRCPALAGFRGLV